MDNTAIVVSAVSIIASSPVVGLAAVWIARIWLTKKIEEEVKHQYAVKLEDHKDRLTLQTTTAIETAKAQLAQQTNEKQFKFSLYYKEMAETLLTLSKSLWRIGAFFVDTLSSKEVIREDNVAECQKQMVLTLENSTHAILYFDTEGVYIAKEIDNVLGDYMNLIRKTESMPLDERKAFVKVSLPKVQDAYSAAYSKLISKSRHLLGFNDQSLNQVGNTQNPKEDN